MKTGRAVAVVGVVLLGAALVGVAMAATGPPGGARPAAAAAGEAPGEAGEAPAAPAGQRAGADPAARSVDALQVRLRRLPTDFTAWAALGTAYVERARLTGDPTFYPKAEAALARSLAIAPDGNDAALAGQAALAAARHDFRAALRLADAAVAVNPHGSLAHGLRVDALVELGRYPEAWRAAQTQVDLRPDVASLSRVAYAFELQGKIGQAREVLQRVLADATSAGDAAFACYHLGELARHDGDLAGARDAYARGLARDPSNVMLLAGRARVLAEEGRVDAALAEYSKVVARAPQPGLVIEYGELLEAAGRDGPAREQYALARSTAGLFRAQGVDVDVELAVFEADHGDPAAALRAVPPPAQPASGAPAASGGPPASPASSVSPASGGRAAQPALDGAGPRRAGIFVDDARAWALHRLGRDAEALPYARSAVALGTHRAQFRYHLGAIEASLGMRGDAAADLRAALALDPHFSPLHATRAQALLATLDGER
jgi:tetratricopeptide (TPR) repeat protein